MLSIVYVDMCQMVELIWLVMLTVYIYMYLYVYFSFVFFQHDDWNYCLSDYQATWTVCWTYLVRHVVVMSKLRWIVWEHMEKEA